MKIVIDRGDQQFLEDLHKMCGGTIQEICDNIGVTATAIRQRLGRLEGLGLVARETVRAGRGRPHHVYRVSDTGLRYLGENYRDLAHILWRAIHEIPDDSVRNEVLSRIRDGFVGRFGRIAADSTLPERVFQLQESLVTRGFLVECDQLGDLPILREKSCPYSELASQDPSICEMEREVFSRISNADVTLTQCCRDGGSYCEFRFSEPQ